MLNRKSTLTIKHHISAKTVVTREGSYSVVLENLQKEEINYWTALAIIF